ncbi:MAG: YraN family protein [Thermoprotei archaeon]|nr:YraN family protein [Thermoprotei archaeon]
MNSRRVWRASEALAARHLESQGFKVVDMHRKITVGGVEVSDIDIVALKDGEYYAVEVKAGSADVDAVRQVYVNSKLANMKPMLIARGLADEKALAVARELGVELNILPDTIVVDVNELREAVYDAVYSALNDILYYVTVCDKMGEEDMKIVRALANSESISEAAEKLGVNEGELISHIAKLSSKNFLPKGVSFKNLTLVSRIIMLACSREKP